MRNLKELLGEFILNGAEKASEIHFKEITPSPKEILKNRHEIEMLLQYNDFSSNELAKFIDCMIFSIGGEEENAFGITVRQSQIFGDERYAFLLRHESIKGETIEPSSIIVEDAKNGKKLEEIKTGKQYYGKQYLTVFSSTSDTVFFEGEMFKEDARVLANTIYKIAFPEELFST